MIALLLGLTSCTTGTYPVDIFPEMHYQPSFRRQEPQRLLPPAGSVPTSGAETPLDTALLASMANPVTSTPELLARAADVYRVNCAVCHGDKGRGDGIIAGYFRALKVTVPADLTSQATKAKSDGEIFGIITAGRQDPATLQGMPPFQYLLTQEERWMLVHQIRAFEAGQ